LADHIDVAGQRREDVVGKDFPVRANAFCLSSEKRASSAPMSPADALCFANQSLAVDPVGLGPPPLA
jgi:hypothetical protein